MTSSTLISSSGQGLSSTQKTVDYLFARDPGGKGRLEGTSSPAPLFIAQTVIAFGNVSVTDDHAVSRRAAEPEVPLPNRLASACALQDSAVLV